MTGMRRRRLVRVPASSANLGPGFDAMAAAVAMHLEVDVIEAGSFSVETDLAIARNRRNLVVRGFEALHPADDFSFRIASDIPLAGGLGSSAAAFVAGLAAADHLFELDADLFGLASELEGHPDNVAAALFGGVVICAGGEVARLDAPVGLEAVVAVPREAVRTREAREALPPEVPMGDAVYNLAHAATLTLGLATGDWELVARGLRDRLHQPRRAHLYPRSAELVERGAELGALGATISGAGPSVLFWSHYEQTAGLVERLQAECVNWADVIRVGFEPVGADVREL
jgi:homoserine kinase